MKLTIALQFITIAVAAFLLIEANKTMDSVDLLVREEARGAYLYACTNGFANKTIIECGMEASDYVEEFVK